MKDLIAALQFLLQFMKNPEAKYPTACDREVLYVCRIDFGKMNHEQARTMASVHGFYPGSGDDWDRVLRITGEDFDWESMTEEQWNLILENDCLDDCVHSYRYGSL